MKMNLLRLSALTGAVLLATGAYAATGTYVGTGLPVAIPDTNTAITSTATAPGPAATTNITDVNVTVAVTHTWADDVDVTLTSTNPAVAATTLFQDCGGSGDFTGGNTILDDAAGAALPCATVGAGFAPNGTLQSPESPTRMAAFNGVANPGATTWTLGVTDDSSICTGTFNAFSVTVTSDAPLPLELSGFSID